MGAERKGGETGYFLLEANLNPSKLLPFAKFTKNEHEAVFANREVEN